MLTTAVKVRRFSQKCQIFNILVKIMYKTFIFCLVVFGVSNFAYSADQERVSLQLGPLSTQVSLPAGWKTSDEINQSLGASLVESDRDLEIAPQFTVVGPAGEVILGMWKLDWPAACLGQSCLNRKVWSVTDFTIAGDDFKDRGWKRDPGPDLYQRKNSEQLPFTFYVFSGLGDGITFGEGKERMYGGYSDTPVTFVKDSVYSHGTATIVLRAKGAINKNTKELFLKIIDSMTTAPGVQLATAAEFLAKAPPGQNLAPSNATVGVVQTNTTSPPNRVPALVSPASKGFNELADDIQAALFESRKPEVNRQVFDAGVNACRDEYFKRVSSPALEKDCEHLFDAVTFVRGDRKKNFERYLNENRLSRTKKREGKPLLCNPIFEIFLAPPSQPGVDTWIDPITSETYSLKDGLWRSTKGKPWGASLKCNSVSQ